MKKVVVLGGVVFFILIAGIFIYIFSQNTNQPSFTPDPVLTLPPKYEAEEASVATKVYISSNFQISHPNSWGAYIYNFPDGQETTFKPLSLSRTDVIPSFQITTSTGTTSETLKAQYDRYSTLEKPYDESQVEINGNQAVILSGSMPFYVQDKKRVDKTIQEKIIYFEKNGVLYSIRYRYVGDQPNVQDEEFFSSFIDTLEVF